MTMPRTAAVVTELGITPSTLDGYTDQQFTQIIAALDEDLPGATTFVAEAAQASAAANGAFTYVARNPAELASKQEWNILVGYLARLFASPYAALVSEWTKRTHGVEVRFVNCCIVAAQAGGVDSDQLFGLQTNQQLTPDC
jgi:hypothetical protein